MSSRPPVYDVDTHLRASAETLEPFLCQRARELMPDRQQFWKPRQNYGYGGERLARSAYFFGKPRPGWGASTPRQLGTAVADEQAVRRPSQFQGSRFPRDGGEDWIPEARLQDMDDEGVTVALMVPNVVGGSGIPELEVAFLQACHRHLDAYCAAAPARLKSLIVANPLYLEASLQEIRIWGAARWAAGIYLQFPEGYPLDHPDLEPLWAAASEVQLPIVHHSYATGYPGQRDLWDNPFLGRSASHPWGGMRTLAAFWGAGIFDRHPQIKLALLETGFGWLPFWARRVDDQAGYMGYVSPALRTSLADCLAQGRIFAAIVLHEGPEMVKMVSELLGEHLLMFSTDYPHPETRFPDSVDLVLNWRLEADLQQKILWDNAVKCFGQP